MHFKHISSCVFNRILTTTWLLLAWLCCTAASAATSISAVATPSAATAPANVTLSVVVNADPEPVTVTGVEYFNGNSSLGVATSAPFSLALTNVAAGTYSIVAKATVENPENPVLVSAPTMLTVTGSVASGASVYYIQTDQLNTPRAITDQANALVWKWDSDPFGMLPPNETPVSSTRFTFNPRYPGQYFDRESNLHYNYYRDYDSQTGRYVQSDPIGLGGGINTYGYVGGNPLRYTDPLGLARNSVEAALQQAILEGNVAEVEVIADAAGIADSSAVARAAANANKIKHIFGDPAHKLEPLVKACGSEGKALGAMRTAAEKAAKGMADGLVRRMPVVVNGVSIQVNGVVTGGVFLLGTGFVP